MIVCKDQYARFLHANIILCMEKPRCGAAGLESMVTVPTLDKVVLSANTPLQELGHYSAVCFTANFPYCARLGSCGAACVSLLPTWIADRI